MKNIKQLKKEIEKKYLKIRGWKNWKEFDKVIESSELDINTRDELIDICIKKTIQKVCEEIEKWIKKKVKDDYWTKDDENGMLDRGKEICLVDLYEELLKKFQGEEERIKKLNERAKIAKQKAREFNKQTRKIVKRARILFPK